MWELARDVKNPGTTHCNHGVTTLKVSPSGKPQVVEPATHASPDKNPKPTQTCKWKKPPIKRNHWIKVILGRIPLQSPPFGVTTPRFGLYKLPSYIYIYNASLTTSLTKPLTSSSPPHLSVSEELHGRPRAGVKVEAMKVVQPREATVASKPWLMGFLRGGGDSP